MADRMFMMDVADVVRDYRPVYPSTEGVEPSWEVTIDFMRNSPRDWEIVQDLMKVPDGLFREPVSLETVADREYSNSLCDPPEEPDTSRLAVYNGTHRMVASILSGTPEILVAVSQEEDDDEEEQGNVESVFSWFTTIVFVPHVYSDDEWDEFALSLSSFRVDDDFWLNADMWSGSAVPVKSESRFELVWSSLNPADMDNQEAFVDILNEAVQNRLSALGVTGTVKSLVEEETM